MNLYLFDVDRTLVLPGREKNFGEVIHKIFGIDVNDDKDYQGLTDQIILSKICSKSGVDKNLPHHLA